jgi:S1-C subfamily serine protease
MRRRASGFLLLLGSSLLALQSCSNAPQLEDIPIDYSILKGEELSALAESDQEACLEALSIIAQSKNPDPGLDALTISRLALAAVHRLVLRMDAELAAERWGDAERSLASLGAIAALRGNLPGESDVFVNVSAIAEEHVTQATMLKIHKGRIAEYTRRNLYSPAAATVHKALDLVSGEGSSEGNADSVNATAPSVRTAVQTAIGLPLLEEWLRKAYAAGDAFTVGKILSLWPDGAIEFAITPNTPVASNASSAQSDSVSSGKAIKTIAENAGAVVTVYVDKGLRIENGVGYPDRILGTAFQVDPQGYYITNYHVVASEVDPEYDGYSRLSVRPSSNPEARIPAKVIGWDEDLDLALLKSQERSIGTLFPFGRGKAFKGQKVYAIGSPVGLESSVTAGIVSATGRRILPKGEAIQIDAPVNPGNSGGPLLDENGELIAIVFAGLSGYQGLNFALPISWVTTVFTSLFEEGRREASWLGLGLAKNLDGSLDILYAFPGKGGIEAGDRLLSIDGKRVKDIETAQLYMATKPIGSLCAIETERDGLRRIQLRKTASQPQMPFKKASSRDLPERLLGGATGMLLQHLDGTRSVGGTYKIMKTWPGLAADESGLGQSDVLKFLKYSVDVRKNSFYFDVSVKSLNSGYLERRMRMNLSLETDNFI